jgi:hypothetical protein
MIEMQYRNVSAAEIFAHPCTSLNPREYIVIEEPTVRQTINSLKALKQRPPPVEQAIKHLERLDHVLKYLTRVYGWVSRPNRRKS